LLWLKCFHYATVFYASVIKAPALEAVGVGTEVEFTWEAALDPDPIETIHYRVAFVNALED
tara:strand:- start:628 stop:810 length:183 start_codon:yes stop_codon:yes gene_type:complete